MATIDQEKKLVLDLLHKLSNILYEAMPCWYGFKNGKFRIITMFKWNFVFYNQHLINKIIPKFRITEVVFDLQGRKLGQAKLKRQVELIKKLKLDV